ncbi:ABC transporter permease [Lutibacter sp.]|uniref:ABC transporter permease n=1 Tax=Lutibacter sp. TaxID=1925666 RepID=UPI0025C68373|nr:ABC transporter permease [Lutibacter sp.]MCF6167053.1 ABC transporter permease [Lutibacter sp.]
MITTIFKKDLKLFFSNKKNVVLTFLIPILLISLFAFAFGGISNESSEDKQVTLLYADFDSSSTSKKIKAQLDTLSTINLMKVTLEEGNNALVKGKFSGFLILNKGFKDSLLLSKKLPITYKYDASNPFEAKMLQSIITGVVMNTVGSQLYMHKVENYMNTKFKTMSNNLKQRILADISQVSFKNMASTTAIIEAIPVIKKSSNTGNLGLIQAVAGTAIMMLLFSISGVGVGLLEEKESGTLSRLLYTPIKTTSILYGKMLATLFISMLQLFTMFVFAWVAFDLPIFKDVISLILLTIAVAFSVSSFGVFLVSISKTRQQLQNLSTILILLMSAIGGSMIPLFVMPSIMRKIAVISLNYWGIQGYYDIFWRNLSTFEILPRIGVLSLIGIVMLLISIPLFKRNIVSLTN